MSETHSILDMLLQSISLPFQSHLWVFFLKQTVFPFENLKKILDFSFYPTSPKVYSDWSKRRIFTLAVSKTVWIYLNLGYLSLLLRCKLFFVLGNCSFFPLLEIIITNFLIPHFKIHQFCFARLIFTISAWPVQSIATCRILFCIYVHLLLKKKKKKEEEIIYQKSQEAEKIMHFSYSILFFFLINKKTE